MGKRTINTRVSTLFSPYIEGVNYKSQLDDVNIELISNHILKHYRDDVKKLTIEIIGETMGFCDILKVNGKVLEFNIVCTLKEEFNSSANTTLKEWYEKTYPTDIELIQEIQSKVTFGDLLFALYQKVDVYDVVFGGSCADSVVRERLFNELSKQLKVDYDTIYNLWLGI